MSGESDFSVYGEAKGEYTRQLCVFLVPTLETYVLELLASAKEEAPTPNKVLWQFQTMLQGIPDWNQDKVIRETEKIQKDCPCDYLEELITAVFIAHTKVLSAIRLTTKQKKLQITIPKIDHFLHRVLSECARTLWTNAYLFADSNSIEKQKNLRQVSSLLNDSVLQAIRGLLPVKSILREYLHDDDDDETKTKVDTGSETLVEKSEVEGDEVEAIAAKESAIPLIQVTRVEPTVGEATESTVPTVALENTVSVEGTVPTVALENTVPTVALENTVSVENTVPTVSVEATVPTVAVVPTGGEPTVDRTPVINIVTKPQVTFSTNHVLFDSDVLEENGIQDIPFADEVPSLEASDEMPMEFDEEL